MGVGVVVVKLRDLRRVKRGGGGGGAVAAVGVV